jgi:predicted PurR-regulated permease PerM
MIEDLKKEFTSFRLLAILLTIAISIYLLQIFWQVIGYFSDVIVILVVAWLLSFILEPLVHSIANLTRLSKVISAIIVYLFFAILFTATIFFFIPIVSNQLQVFSNILPQYLSSFPKSVQSWNNSVTNSLDNFVTFIPSLATIFINIVLILILSFYFIVDKETINAEIYRLSPKSWHKHLKFIQGVVNDTFSSFLRIQVIFGIVSGVFTWLVLSFFLVDFAASISLLSGILTVIPLVGPLLALIPPVLVSLVTNPNNPTEAVIILAILLIFQQILFNAVGPKLMGKAFRLHPIIVFLSIIIGFKVAGPLGGIFAVPFLGIGTVVLKELAHYFINPETSSK